VGPFLIAPRSLNLNCWKKCYKKLFND